jgi:hypothetical protein
MDVENAVAAVAIELFALFFFSMVLYFISELVREFRYDYWKWFERWPGLNKRWFDWVGAVAVVLALVVLFLVLVGINLLLFGG